MTDAYPADTLADMARWLLARTDQLRVHPAGGEAVEEITAAVADVRRVIDRPPGTLYVGSCDGTGRVTGGDREQPCGYALHAGFGAQWVRCPLCGATYDVDSREEWLLEAMEDAVGSPAELVGCFKRLRVPVGYSTILAYVAQRRLVPHSHDSDGNALYRGGDVLDVRFKRHAVLKKAG